MTGLSFIRIGHYSSSSTYPLALVADILDYTNTNKYKTIRYIGGYDNNGSGEIQFSLPVKTAFTSVLGNAWINISGVNYTAILKANANSSIATKIGNMNVGWNYVQKKTNNDGTVRYLKETLVALASPVASNVSSANTSSNSIFGGL